MRTYRDNPLFIRGRNLTVSKENKHYQIHWRNKTTCLKVILGRKPSQVGQVKQTLDSVINGSYKVCDSSIQSKGKKLFLLLTVQHEKQEMYLDANKVIGVDVGINVSAFCVLNTNVEIRKQIGNERKLIESKSKLQAMRRKAQSSARYSKGGHGRTRKTRYIEQLKERERNFAKTYNNQISHDVVQFALKCRAGVIHLEKLTAKGLDDETRMQWTYYQLQEMIEQKANKYNIEVVYVPATYTSQKCSLCGHIDKENRKSQAEFKCTKCENEMNADWNAAINIAQAVLQ